MKNRDEFFVVVDPQEYFKWRKDRSIPIVDVLALWEVYIIRGVVKGEPCHPSAQELRCVLYLRSIMAFTKQIALKGKHLVQQD